MSALRSCPYADVADRPLLIIQLILLFRRQGYLPEQPSVVYEMILRLMLQDWDAERRIARRSKYANFTPDRKLAFLAALSYQLTYISRAKVFRSSELVKAYLAIRKGFGLPEDEATRVAREIQSHTGIILATGNDSYEFCHLSLQEYLCAYYIVRAPLVERLVDYISRYPAPLAIAVSLSSNPSNWLAGLLLDERNLRALHGNSLVMFLGRLMVERPFLTETPALGCAVLSLYYHLRFSPWMNWGPGGKVTQTLELLDRLVQDNSVKQSIAEALPLFWIVPSESRDDMVWLTRAHLLKIAGFPVPPLGAIPLALFSTLFASIRNLMAWVDDILVVHQISADFLSRLQASIGVNSRSGS